MAKVILQYSCDYRARYPSVLFQSYVWLELCDGINQMSETQS